MGREVFRALLDPSSSCTRIDWVAFVPNPGKQDEGTDRRIEGDGMSNDAGLTWKQALEALARAVETGDWVAAVAAGVAASEALEYLRREDADLPISIWLGSDESQTIAEAAASAIGNDRLDIAAQLLEVIPRDAEDAELEELRQATVALAALLSNDAELALATLDITTRFNAGTGRLLESIAGKVAEALDAGSGEQRLLGVYVLGTGGEVSGDGFKATETRQAQWAASRQLPNDPETLTFALAAMCRRRCAAPDHVKVFEACFARHGSDFIDAPRLLEEAALHASRCLEAGSLIQPCFRTFALHALLHGRESEVRERLDAMVKARPGLAKSLSRLLEGARELLARRSVSEPQRLVPAEANARSAENASGVDSDLFGSQEGNEKNYRGSSRYPEEERRAKKAFAPLSSEQIRPLLELWRRQLSEPVRWLMKYGVESGWLVEVARFPRVAAALAREFAVSESLKEWKIAAHLAGELADAPLLEQLLKAVERRPDVLAHSVVESLMQASTVVLARDATSETARRLLQAIAESPVGWNTAAEARQILQGQPPKPFRPTWQKAQAEIKVTPEERRAFEAWLALATSIERGESVADGGG
ncbi:MAG: hypothetical protein HY901_35085 [Deltaproteobacteria bacterium]|nr:hypothetical protein [Deltaproteobacteria bacterium]